MSSRLKPGAGAKATPGVKGSKTYVPLSRGWRDHLPKLTGNAVKLYNLLLIDAKFAGPNKGKVAMSFADLARELRIHKTSVVRAVRELQPHYIALEPAKNQHSATVFTVKRYKAITDFAGSASAPAKGSAGSTSAPAKGSAGCKMRPAEGLLVAKCDQHVYSTARKPNGQQGLLAPNNGEKVGEEAVATPATLLGEEWKVLGVERPIGPPNFQRYWKSVFTHRNGQPLSELMEDCIQGWQATGSDARPQFVPRPFYAVKREVEKRERQETERCEEREMVQARIPG